MQYNSFAMEKSAWSDITFSVKTYTAKFSLFFLAKSSESLSCKSEEKPEPVPPPKLWNKKNPCGLAAFSASRLICNEGFEICLFELLTVNGLAHLLHHPVQHLLAHRVVAAREVVCLRYSVTCDCGVVNCAGAGTVAGPLTASSLPEMRPSGWNSWRCGPVLICTVRAVRPAHEAELALPRR